jgi:hypothetical protein
MLPSRRWVSRVSRDGNEAPSDSLRQIVDVRSLLHPSTGCGNGTLRLRNERIYSLFVFPSSHMVPGGLHHVQCDVLLVFSGSIGMSSLIPHQLRQCSAPTENIDDSGERNLTRLVYQRIFWVALYTGF